MQAGGIFTTREKKCFFFFRTRTSFLRIDGGTAAADFLTDVQINMARFKLLPKRGREEERVCVCEREREKEKER